MDEFVARERAYLLDSGAKSALIMPYPYEKGHFCVYREGGVREFVYMRESAFVDAAKSWSVLPRDFSGDEDEFGLRVRTYLRLTEGRFSGEAGEMPANEKLLIRMLMDGHLRGMRETALDLISSLYPVYLRRRKDMSVLRAAVLKLSADSR